MRKKIPFWERKILGENSREEGAEKRGVKTFFLNIFFCILLLRAVLGETLLAREDFVEFSSQKASLIPWSDLNERKFFDFQNWKRKKILRQRDPLAGRNTKKTRLVEKMGYVLDCVGECRNYRGLGHARVGYLSRIHEADEVVTMKDSFMWIFLLDGTLVRLSPETSVSFKEFNRGESENFIYSRINFGNILWWSRSTSPFIAQDFKETDSLFLPLVMYEANFKSVKAELKENDLFGYLRAKQNYKEKYERLNALIQESNKIIKIPTYSFLTMPNGTLYGREIVAEFFVHEGGKSYFKRRGKEQLHQGVEVQNNRPQDEVQNNDEESKDVSFFFRGYNNKDEEHPLKGRWYEVDPKGNSLREFSDQNNFGIGEFVTSNIPSILVARELLLQRYSSPFHQKMESFELANKGYRLWGSLSLPESDSSQRLEFLKEYTRRIETTNLSVAEKFRKKLGMEREGDEESFDYSKYFRRAMGYFYNYREEVTILSKHRELLNSERKIFWKRIHERRK